MRHFLFTVMEEVREMGEKCCWGDRLKQRTGAGGGGGEGGEKQREMKEEI